MNREEEIIFDAVSNLRKLADLEDIVYTAIPCVDGYDYDVTINGVTFACEVKTLVNKTNFCRLAQQMDDLKAKTNKPLMIVAQHFVPDLFLFFAERGINVVESNGNCKISEPPLFIRISGQKAIQPAETKGKAFNEAGLKLIFYFLLDKGNVAKPYRQISEETGLSLGTIKYVLEELTKKYFVMATAKGRSLANKKELLDLWQAYFNQTLKPKLKLKELEFMDKERFKNWENLPLPDGMCWGGEGGAYLLDHYLAPEHFDVYTEIPSAKLAMTGSFKFQEKGSICVYRKFWKGHSSEKVAPRILIYADLMGSGNSRCVEAAQRLVENGI